MAEIQFIESLHQRTPRNYLERVTSYDKASCALMAKQWGQEYWDGARQYGYGGYCYDGRWRVVAERIIHHYGLKPGDRILDVGCGKAHLLYEFTQAMPGLQITGLDLSHYGLIHAKEEIRPYLTLGTATSLPFPDHRFDLVISLNTLHNLPCYDLESALREIIRVGRHRQYVVVESYRNESEKVNLLYWQLTCESFHSPQGWQWWFEKCGYTGDFGFIYFS